MNPPTMARPLHAEPSVKTGLKLDLLASFTGTGWSALVQFACIPLYIRFLGVEGYGLVGFYLMFVAMLQVLDLGITPTVNREMARFSTKREQSDRARDLVRTLELIYWSVGLAIGLATIAAAPLIAAHWIRSSHLPTHEVRQVVRVMGVLAVFQWPVSFYLGGLIGLHRQVLANVIKVVYVTLSGGGALFVLAFISRSVMAF